MHDKAPRHHQHSCAGHFTYPEDLPEDVGAGKWEEVSFAVGSLCGPRVHAAHRLWHYRYHLTQKMRRRVKDELERLPLHVQRVAGEDADRMDTLAVEAARDPRLAQDARENWKQMMRVSAHAS